MERSDPLLHRACWIDRSAFNFVALHRLLLILLRTQMYQENMNFQENPDERHDVVASMRDGDNRLRMDLLYPAVAAWSVLIAAILPATRASRVDLRRALATEWRRISRCALAHRA